MDVYGFITALNGMQPDYSKQVRIDNEAIKLTLRNCCKDQTIKLFDSAVGQFFKNQMR